MAAIRTTTTAFVREFFRPPPPPYSSLLFIRAYSSVLPSFVGPFRLISRSISYTPVRCAASNSGEGGKKSSARMSQVQQLMIEAEERALFGANEPIPRITLVCSQSPSPTTVHVVDLEGIEDHCFIDHVTVSFARSGGAGGQNVNKVNTKVDMRFNVNHAYWLSERVREKILQMEKNRINKDGEIVISSTKTRTQKGNIEDALEKLQAIIDAASYVPPPPSEEQKKRVAKIAAASEHKRLQNKKALSQKKSFRRNRSNDD